jgi:peptide chain release factor 1
MKDLLDSLKKIENKYNNILKKLKEPGIIKDRVKVKKYIKMLSQIESIVKAARKYKKIRKEIEETKGMLKTEKDKELIKLIEEELLSLKKQKSELESEIEELLVPKDTFAEKDIIVEIRAGAGGEEAALFAADLFKMYSKYAEKNNFNIKVFSSNISDLSGFKEIIFEVSGKGAYEKFKYESGVHRVQRVPITESSGRIHTSTTTVAVLPVAEEVDVEIKPEDLSIETFHASGPGGQYVNVTDSAVRITHIPTNMVVSCQDERSQFKNKQKALKILRARLLDMKIKEQQKEIAAKRKVQIGTGERSEKIRTYNFPQNRVTDHRIGLTLHKLDQILSGEIDELINTLLEKEHEERLKHRER